MACVTVVEPQRNGDDVVLRQLASQAELEPWTRLCAAGFAESGTPQEYFLRHYQCDPAARLGGVFVAQVREPHRRRGDAKADARHHFVASVRVMHRAVHVGDGSDGILTMGGIGEVCTLPAFRRRGIAGQLLRMSVEYMSKAGVQFSSLHGAALARPLYQRNGWESVPMLYGFVHAPRSVVDTLRMTPGALTLRRADGKDPRCAAWLDHMHEVYAAHAAHVPGSMVRSRAYFAKWVRSCFDAPGQRFMWVFPQPSAPGATSTSPAAPARSEAATHIPCALLGFKERLGYCVLAACIFDEEHVPCGEGLHAAIAAAARAAAPRLGVDMETGTAPAQAQAASGADGHGASAKVGEGGGDTLEGTRHVAGHACGGGKVEEIAGHASSGAGDRTGDTHATDSLTPWPPSTTSHPAPAVVCPVGAMQAWGVPITPSANLTDHAWMLRRVSASADAGDTCAAWLAAHGLPSAVTKPTDDGAPAAAGAAAAGGKGASSSRPFVFWPVDNF